MVRHVACSEAFATTNSTTSRTRSGDGSKKQSMPERLGFFSFGQGDAVCYIPLEGGDPNIDISVFGVIYKDANGDEQGRKYLVLYEVKTETFFIGSWTHYARRCKKGIAQNNANMPQRTVSFARCRMRQRNVCWHSSTRAWTSIS